MRKKHLAIIGHGMAGSRLLDELLARGAAERYDITVFGEERTAAYNRVLLGRVLAGGDTGEIRLKPDAWHGGDNVAVRPDARVDRVDVAGRTLHTSAGESVPYDLAVLATGSRAFVPPIDGVRLPDGRPKPGVFVYRTLADVIALRDACRPGDNAVVLGGGLLGLEAAKALSDNGLHVTVVHLSGHLMNTQIDENAGRVLAALIERQGLFVRCGRTIKAVLGEQAVHGVRLDDGTTLSADAVVLACGIRPNVELAEASGLPVNRAVLVNDTLATQVPGVYAVGECCEHRGRVYGIVAPIYEQCRVLAEVLCGRVNGKPPRYLGSKPATRLKVAGVEVASMGVVDPELATDRSVVVAEPQDHVYRKLVLRDGRLIGAHLVGETSAAGRLIQTFEKGEPVPANPLELLCDFAPASAGSPSTRQVCNCNAVTEQTVRDAIAAGAASVEAVGRATRAGTGCGSCRSQVATLLGSAGPA